MTSKRRPRNPAMSAAMARTGHTFASLGEETGLNPLYLGRVCNRRTTPKLATAIAIAKALGVPVEELEFVGQTCTAPK